MYNHAPQDYECPFCSFLSGKETDKNQKQDIVYQNEYVTACIAPKWWINNPGHVLVIPNKHFENIYDITDEYLSEIYKAVKKVAVAIRGSYGCDGTSIRQHNEPAGDQDVWHFHVHVYPRYNDDDLYLNHGKKMFVEAEKRLPYAEKLRAYFAEQES